MTAISGLVQWGGRPPDAAAACAAMQRALSPYGADRVAAWDGGDVALGIGLARLLPEDRHDRQPLSGGGGRWQLVADLRLDNRAELAARLGIDARDAASLAESDLLLRAWETWREGTPHHLVGDFAFAVWDADERRLHLVRDFLGQRPLFYHLGDRVTAFASMARGLHALDGVPVAPDLDRLRDYLALAPMRGEASFFAGISRVEPGEHVTLGPGGRVARDVWYGWDRIPPVRLARDEDYVEAFRETFDRAVSDRLRASVPVASQLSGGLDSTAVTATAARMLAERGRRLRAYTHVPLAGVALADAETRNGNEWALAQEVAKLHANIDHVPIEAAGRSIGGDLDAQFHYFQYPALNLCNLVWMREISRLAGRGGRSVLLSAVGGNATISLAGLERPAELFCAGQWGDWLRECLALVRNGHSVAGAFVGRTFAPLMTPWLYALLLRAGGRRPGSVGAFSSLHREIRESAAFKAHLRGLRFDPNFRPWPSVRGFSALVLRRLDIHGLEQKGQMAAFGVDMRDPTSDRRLVELVHGLPSHLFLRNGQAKWLYHRAFADRVPAPVRAAKQKGLQGADWQERLRRAQPFLKEEFALARAEPSVRALLEVEDLARDLDCDLGTELPHRDSTQRFRFRLLRGVSVSHFLRKTGTGNAAPGHTDL